MKLDLKTKEVVTQSVLNEMPQKVAVPVIFMPEKQVSFEQLKHLKSVVSVTEKSESKHENEQMFMSVSEMSNGNFYTTRGKTVERIPLEM